MSNTTESIADAFFAVGPDWRFTYVNAQAEQLLARKRHDLLGKCLWDEFPQVLGTVFEDNYRRALAQGAQVVFEALCSPQARWYEVRAYPSADGLAVYFRDATDRKRADEALRESEERYRDLFENANDIIYTLDLEGHITSLNKRAEQTFGYDRAECLGMSAAKLVPPEFHARMYDALRRKLTGEATPTTYELEVVSKDGRRVPLEVSSRLIVRGGQPAGIQGIARDITERRRAEAALRESEARFRRIAETAHEGIWQVDREARTVFVNRRMAELLGCSLDEVAWRSVTDFVFETEAGIMQQRLNANLRGEVEQFDFRFRRADGAEVLVQGCTSPVAAPSGAVVGALAMFSDITDRKRAEEALKEADRRKDEFLAMLAHELRNPLTPIRNAVQVLDLLGLPHAELRQVREMIARQVAHLARLVDDLLDVSRISRGKVLLRKEWLDLVALVRATVEDHRLMLAGTRLRLVVELPDQPLWVMGDPTRLLQVVGNLLHNANKFTDAGGLVAVRLLAEGGEAVLSVKDTGIGLEAEMLARLFEPFSQADRSLDRSRGGLGLGLALVKGLVELHGGCVRAVSAGPGQGTELTIRLPLSQAPEEARRAPADRPSYRRALRALLIEDNRDAAESMRLLLQYSGHEVAVAYAGASGLTAAREFRPDVVLCDIGLPGGLDGYAVARALRASAELNGTTLLALSGYGQEEDQRKAREAGFDVHLTKPVDPTALMELLDGLPMRAV